MYPLKAREPTASCRKGEEVPVGQPTVAGLMIPPVALVPNHDF